MSESIDPPPHRASHVNTTPRDGIGDWDGAFGRYRILSRLGSGGFGVVDLAYDVVLARRVALKRWQVRPGIDSVSTEVRELLHLEAQRHAQVMHPHIVTVYDVGVIEDVPFVALEYLSGGDFAQMITKRPGRHLMGMLLQAASALAALHNAGIIHGDFKPANLLIDENAQIKLADFGLSADERHARAASLDLEGCDDARSLLARLGYKIDDIDAQALGDGTPSYMAPEIHLGQAATRASDQYAFCVAACEALTGRRPFTAHLLDEWLEQKVDHLHANRVIKQLPRALRAVILRGLSPHADDRFRDIEELAQAMEDARVNRQRFGWSLTIGTGLGALLVSLALQPKPSFATQTCQALSFAIGDSIEQGLLAPAFSQLETKASTDPRMRAAVNEWQALYADYRNLVDQTCERPPWVEVDTVAVACLHEHWKVFTKTVDMAGQSPSAMVQRLVNAAQREAQPSDCAASVSHHRQIAQVQHASRVLGRWQENIGVAQAQIAAGQSAYAVAAIETWLANRDDGVDPLAMAALIQIGSEAAIEALQTRKSSRWNRIAILLATAVDAPLQVHRASVTGANQRIFVDLDPDAQTEQLRLADAQVLRLGDGIALDSQIEHQRAWAFSLFQNDEFIAAQNHYRRALDLLHRVPHADPRKKAEIWFRLAPIYALFGEHAMALDSAQRAMDEFRRATPVEAMEVARAAVAIGYAALGLGDVASAYHQLDQARKWVEEVSEADPMQKAYVWRAWANMACSLGRYDEAQIYNNLRGALFLNSVGTKHAFIGGVRKESGICALDARMLDESHALLAASLEVVESIPFIGYRKPAHQVLMSRVSSAQGQCAAAERWLAQSDRQHLDEARKHGEEQDLSNFYLAAAQIAKNRDDLGAAAEAYERAVTVMDAHTWIGNRLPLIANLEAIANLLEGGRWEHARDQLTFHARSAAPWITLAPGREAEMFFLQSVVAAFELSRERANTLLVQALERLEASQWSPNRRIFALVNALDATRALPFDSQAWLRLPLLDALSHLTPDAQRDPQSAMRWQVWRDVQHRSGGAFAQHSSLHARRCLDSPI
jgi:serine/threonine protein kinase/tetratricopeptide (TPR) repeat protein